MAHSHDERATRRSDALLFALLLFTFAYFHQGGFANQNARFDLTLAVALEHRIPIDTLAANTIDKVLVGGRYYLEKAPGASYLALPVPLVASLFVSMREVLERPGLGDGLLYLSTVLSVGLLSAASAVAMRRLFSHLVPGLTVAGATLRTLAVYGSTLLLPYSTMLFGHGPCAAWIVIGAALLLTNDAPSTARALAGGAALGAAMLTEYPAAVPVAGVLAAAVLRRRPTPRELLGVLAACGAVVSLVLVHNALTFGSPWTFGYGKLQGTIFEARMSRGLFGITLPRPTVALQLLFGTYRGLFIYCPSLAVAALGLAYAPRRLSGPLVAAWLTHVLVISGYGFWEGGTCFGPRHLVASIPLLAVGWAFLPNAMARSPLAALLVAASALVMLAGTAITPNVAEQVRTPLTSAYLPLARRGVVSMSPMGFLTPHAENAFRHAHVRLYPDAAWNLGELFGLRGPTSLLPLAAAWAAALFVLVRASRGGDDPAPVRAP